MYWTRPETDRVSLAQKKWSKGMKLRDGNGLFGKGGLTDAKIGLLQNYYEPVIRRNVRKHR